MGPGQLIGKEFLVNRASGFKRDAENIVPSHVGGVSSPLDGLVCATLISNLLSLEYDNRVPNEAAINCPLYKCTRKAAVQEE